MKHRPGLIKGIFVSKVRWSKGWRAVDPLAYVSYGDTPEEAEAEKVKQSAEYARYLDRCKAQSPPHPE